MNRKDIKDKIEKAIRISDGDVKAASREVLEYCIHDHDFLLGISEPFLRGIIGHAIKDVMETSEKSEAVSEEAQEAPKMLDVEGLSKVTGLGADILQTALATTGGSHKFGTADRTRSTLGRKTKASEEHVDALKAFVKSQTKKD